MFSQSEKCFPLKLINNCFQHGDRAIVAVRWECILMDCLLGISIQAVDKVANAIFYSHKPNKPSPLKGQQLSSATEPLQFTKH